MTLPESEQTFFFDALAQLAPELRPVFTAQVLEYLQVLSDPGPGDVDRALRVAWSGLWTPPPIEELRTPSRWDRDVPRFDRVSKGAAA
jgi:hypothetical protein